MLALEITPQLEERLDALARKAGLSKSALAREAVIAYLEDPDDGYLAQERLDANEEQTVESFTDDGNGRSETAVQH